MLLLTTTSVPSRRNRWLRAACVLGRAAFGLLRHALLSPGSRATISRATGKVAAR